MGSHVKLNLSGRIGLQEITDAAEKISKAIDCSNVDLSIINVDSLDLTCIQLIAGLQERFGSSFKLQIDSINPDLKTLLSNTGIYKIINVSSN